MHLEAGCKKASRLLGSTDTNADMVRTWYKVAELEDLSEDVPVGVQIGGTLIALFLVAGEVYATADACTHEFAQLSEGFLEDGIIECPLHQARFDCRTGVCLGPPAERNLETYPVKIEDSDVLVGLP